MTSHGQRRVGKWQQSYTVHQSSGSRPRGDGNVDGGIKCWSDAPLLHRLATEKRPRAEQLDISSPSQPSAHGGSLLVPDVGSVQRKAQPGASMVDAVTRRPSACARRRRRPGATNSYLSLIGGRQSLRWCPPSSQLGGHLSAGWGRGRCGDRGARVQTHSIGACRLRITRPCLHRAAGVRGRRAGAPYLRRSVRGRAGRGGAVKGEGSALRASEETPISRKPGARQEVEAMINRVMCNCPHLEDFIAPGHPVSLSATSRAWVCRGFGRSQPSLDHQMEPSIGLPVVASM